MELIIASNNRGKVREYRDILEPLGFRVFSQQEKGICLEVEETGTTFEENARLKARAVYDLAHCAVISDDSGLQVEVLGGEPGIYSARYRGLATEGERRQAVLDGLKGSDSRKARFVCCICYIDASGQGACGTGPSRRLRKAPTASATIPSSLLKTPAAGPPPACRSPSRRAIPTGRRPSAG